MALAVHLAGILIGETLAVFYSGGVSCPEQGGFEIGAYLVFACNDEYAFVAEYLAGEPVASAVDVEYLAVFRDGVGTCDIDLSRIGLLQSLKPRLLPVPEHLVVFSQNVVKPQVRGSLASAYADARAADLPGKIADSFLTARKVTYFEMSQLQVSDGFFNVHI